MKTPVFEGACTAIVTPFCERGIDSSALKKQLDFQAENGIKAVVIAGTTGENAALELREYELLCLHAIRHAAGRMKCIVGIGGNHTEECLRKAEFAEAAGADALLMTAPYYNKTTQAGLVAHFSYVADRIGIPLILYNVPSRTAIGISAETYAALAAHPMINGVKESSGDFSLIAEIRNRCSEFNIWCGNDDQTIPMMALGARGTVSVASNVIPADVSEICELCLNGNFEAARHRYGRIAQLCRLLFAETNPIPVKAAMAMCGTDSGLLRLPLVPLTSGNADLLRAELEKLGLPVQAS